MTAEVPGPEMEAGAFLLGSGRSQTVLVLAGPAGPQPPAPLVEAPSLAVCQAPPVPRLLSPSAGTCGALCLYRLKPRRRHGMNRRLFLLTSAAALAAGPAFAQKISLDRISRYFNSIRTAEARFRQVNDDGSRSTGSLVMQRPGRIRFDYDDPLDVLVLASAGQVGIFDGASNLQKAERYPLNQTPLALILARRVDIGNTSAVRGHYEEDGVTTVVVQDPRRRELGYVELKFRDQPVRLVGWRTVDGGGSSTELYLSDFETGAEYPAYLFSIKREEDRRF